MKPKIDQVELIVGKRCRAIVWNADNECHYYKSVGPASLQRLHRAQLHLAGIPVTGWPFCRKLSDTERAAYLATLFGLRWLEEVDRVFEEGVVKKAELDAWLIRQVGLPAECEP